MSEYGVGKGGEDRDGEMTGAITVNMILTTLPVCIWGVFVGPLLFSSLWPTVVIAAAMAVVLPMALRPMSQRLWSRLSVWVDRF